MSETLAFIQYGRVRGCKALDTPVPILCEERRQEGWVGLEDHRAHLGGE